jgi:hypothetical protein
METLLRSFTIRCCHLDAELGSSILLGAATYMLKYSSTHSPEPQNPLKYITLLYRHLAVVATHIGAQKDICSTLIESQKAHKYLTLLCRHLADEGPLT